MCWLLLLLIQLQQHVHAQDDDAADAGGDDAGGDDADGDEEAWLYVEFLKTELRQIT